MSQKITKLEVNNFIGITEAAIEPKKMTVIRGKNGQGKTSWVEAIKAALRGAGADKIRVGASKSEIFIATDEIEVRRRITAAGSTVTVKKDGVTISKPQAYLDGIIGDFSFEPVRFFLMSPKEQTEYLLKAIPVKATLEQLKTWTRGLLSALDGFLPLHGLEAISLAEKTLYDLRAADNARVKTLESAITELENTIPAGAKDFNPADMQAVMEQISAAKQQEQEYTRITGEIESCGILEKELTEELTDVNSKMDDKSAHLSSVTQTAAGIVEIAISPLEAKREAAAKALAAVDLEISQALSNNQRKADSNTKISYLKESIADLVKFQDSAKAKLLKNKADRAAYEAKLSKMESVNVTPLNEQLDAMKKAQEYQRDLDRLSDMFKELKTVKKSAEDRDKAVKTLQTVAPAEMLKAAKMPVDGLAYSAGQFTLHGVPIQNLSTSEKARLAVAVTKQLNSGYPIKVICLDGFESLDTETQTAFMEEAAHDDFQYFVTCVGDSDMTIKTE